MHGERVGESGAVASRTGALDELVAVVLEAAREVGRRELALKRAAHALRGAAAHERLARQLAGLRDAALVLTRLLRATVHQTCRIPLALPRVRVPYVEPLLDDERVASRRD